MGPFKCTFHRCIWYVPTHFSWHRTIHSIHSTQFQVRWIPAVALLAAESTRCTSLLSLQHQLQHENVSNTWRLKFWAKGQLSSFESHYATAVLLRASSLHVAEINTAPFWFPIFINGISFVVVGRILKTDRLDGGRICWCEIGEQFLKSGHFVFQKWIRFYNLITSWPYPQHTFSWFLKQI